MVSKLIEVCRGELDRGSAGLLYEAVTGDW